jgi:hypothetical protein
MRNPLQDRIDAAKPGDTVFVPQETFEELVVSRGSPSSDQEDP